MLAAVLALACLQPVRLPAQTLEEAMAAYRNNDFETAYAMLRPLAAAGNAQAALTIGIMHEHGQGIEQNNALAMRWYTQAAAEGMPRVQHDLGVKYYLGDTVDADPKMAAHWWHKAAKQGLADSQYSLGILYLRGKGVERDENTAASYFTKAAEQGHTQAQYSIAVMRAFGQGVTKDYDRAVEWFEKAAANNMAEAQYNLAVLIEKGHGTKANLGQAVYWYRRAARQGQPQAIARLEELGEPLAAAAAESVAAEPVAADGDGWLARQDPAWLTLQLASTTGTHDADDFIRRHALGAQARASKVGIKGQARYNVLYGAYPTREAAEVAIEGLPAALQQAKPWIRSIGSVQKIAID